MQEMPRNSPQTIPAWFANGCPQQAVFVPMLHPATMTGVVLQMAPHPQSPLGTGATLEIEVLAPLLLHWATVVGMVQHPWGPFGTGAAPLLPMTVKWLKLKMWLGVLAAIDRLESRNWSRQFPPQNDLQNRLEANLTWQLDNSSHPTPGELE